MKSLDHVYVCDCETDGFVLETTKIHTFGIGWKNGSGKWSVKDTADYSDMIKVLTNPENVCIFHNGYSFDKKVLEKVLDIKIQAFIIDTLPISWVLFPDRLKHGLESFGETYGFKKPKIESWTDLSYEEYANRVREDVRINIALWEDCLNYYRELYEGDDAKIWGHIRFLCSIMQLVADQETYGIKLDVPKCEQFIEELSAMANEKIEILKKVMPPIPIKRIMTKPKVMSKKDGSVSTAGQKWLDYLNANGIPENFEGTLEITTDYEEPNPMSVSQVKDYLFSLGWEPEIFQESVNTKGETKNVPQIKDKDKNLCKSILRLAEEIPELEALADLSTINHRKAYLVGFLKNKLDNDYIQAQISGLTNTIRLKHKTLVNLPKVSAAFGKYVRPVLTCEDDEVLIGSDLSSLENYTRTNFIADIQPEALDILEDPTYDTHTQLAIFAGLMSEEEEAFFKWYKKDDRNVNDLPENFKVYKTEEELKEQFGRLNKIRNKAKTTSYSALYGVGKAKLARELKIPVKEAEQLLEGYWKLNFAVKVFSGNCEVKKVRGKTWVLSPGNGFWYTLRSEKDIFSTVNQGYGSYLHMLWCANMKKRGVRIVGNFHDEVVVVCKKSEEETIKSIMRECIELTNRQTKLRAPLKIDIQVGRNYGEIH